MNESPQTNKGIITLVVITLSFNATVGLTALGYCMVFGIKPDQVLLTAFISIITGLLGLIGGMLTKTAPTETQRQMQPPTNDSPAPVTVVNPVSDPVPTVETEK